MIGQLNERSLLLMQRIYSGGDHILLLIHVIKVYAFNLFLGLITIVNSNSNIPDLPQGAMHLRYKLAILLILFPRNETHNLKTK